MIVPTMTEGEVQKILLSELNEVLSFSDKKDRDFRRKVIKASVFPVYAHSIHKTKGGNNWYVLFEARNKKEVGELSRITMVCIINTKIGYQAMMIAYLKNRPYIIFYSSHFFSRYRERMGIDKSGIDLILEYFKHNNSYAFDCRFGGVIGTSLHGAGLGYETECNNILFKTFISYEMLRDDQQVLFEIENSRKKIHEI